MYTPKATKQQIDAAAELIESLSSAGITIRRRNRSLEINGDIAAGLRAAIERSFIGLMFIVRCQEEAGRVLGRFTRAQERHTAFRVRAHQRKHAAAKEPA